MRNEPVNPGAFAIFLLLVIGSSTAAPVAALEHHAGVFVTFSVASSSILPGTSTVMQGSIRNAGREDVLVAPVTRLAITREGSAPEFAKYPGGAEKANIAQEQFRLRPGEEKEFSFGVNQSLENEWFEDRRLAVPGKVSLRLEIPVLQGEDLRLAEKLQEENPETNEIDLTYSYSSYPVEWITSNPVLLDIRTPDGENAAVWNRLLEAGGGDWNVSDWFNNPTVSADIVEKWPGSDYAPWAAYNTGSRNGSRKDIMKAMLRRHPASPFAPVLAMAVANLLASDAFVIVRSDIAVAQSLCREAREILRTALKNPSLNARVAEMLRRELAAIHTDDDLNRMRQGDDASRQRKQSAD